MMACQGKYANSGSVELDGETGQSCKHSTFWNAVNSEISCQRGRHVTVQAELFWLVPDGMRGISVRPPRSSFSMFVLFSVFRRLFTLFFFPPQVYWYRKEQSRVCAVLSVDGQAWS